jgi:hypothetical protein
LFVVRHGTETKLTPLLTTWHIAHWKERGLSPRALSAATGRYTKHRQPDPQSHHDQLPASGETRQPWNPPTIPLLGPDIRPLPRNSPQDARSPGVYPKWPQRAHCTSVPISREAKPFISTTKVSQKRLSKGKKKPSPSHLSSACLKYGDRRAEYHIQVAGPTSRTSLHGRISHAPHVEIPRRPAGLEEVVPDRGVPASVGLPTRIGGGAGRGLEIFQEACDGGFSHPLCSHL